MKGALKGALKGAPSRRVRLSAFAALYFVQGSALAYIWNFMKPHLNACGVGANRIALLGSLLLVPFVFKILIGVLSDRVSLFGFGHRLPYIVLGLGLAAAAFGAVAFVSPATDFGLFAAMLLLGSFGITLFDSATDGLAIDITPAAEQSTVQGVMTGSRASGMVVLSLVFGRLAAAPGGYTEVFLIVAAAALLPLALVALLREPQERGEEQRFQWSAFREFSRRRFVIFGAFAVVSTFVSYGVNGLVTYHLAKTFGAAERTIGTYGTIRGLGAVAGALSGAFLIDRIGRRTATFGGLAAISVLAVLISRAADASGVMTLGFFWGVAWGFMDTVGVTLAMTLADTRIAASMYACMMALFNVGNALGEGIATSLTDDVGFKGVFLLLAGVNGLVFPIVYALFRTAPEIGRRAAHPGA